MKLRHLAYPLLAIALFEGISVATAHWQRKAFLEQSPSPAVRLADRMTIHKDARRLELHAGDELVGRFDIRLGFTPAGGKRKEGDGRTPEGHYRIASHNPRSAYYLSLRIDYPTPAQRRVAQTAGVDPGGDIVIHGSPNWAAWAQPLLARWDWTRGCIALANDDLERLWWQVPDGTQVEILP